MKYEKSVKANCIELFAGYGLNIEEISERTGITKMTITRWLTKYWFMPSPGQEHKIIKRYGAE